MTEGPPPLVTWAQRPEMIFLTVCLEDCKDPKIEIKSNYVKFQGKGGPDRGEHNVIIHLLKEINPDESKIVIKERVIEFQLKKKGKGPYWKRLLKDEAKQHWLRVDFNKWQDEDFSCDEDATDAAGDNTDKIRRSASAVAAVPVDIPSNLIHPTGHKGPIEVGFVKTVVTLQYYKPWNPTEILVDVHLQCPFQCRSNYKRKGWKTKTWHPSKNAKLVDHSHRDTIPISQGSWTEQHLKSFYSGRNFGWRVSHCDDRHWQYQKTHWGEYKLVMSNETEWIIKHHEHHESMLKWGVSDDEDSDEEEGNKGDMTPPEEAKEHKSVSVKEKGDEGDIPSLEDVEEYESVSDEEDEGDMPPLEHLEEYGSFSNEEEGDECDMPPLEGVEEYESVD